MAARVSFQAVAMGLLLGLSGCGRYTIVFEVEDVINTDALTPQEDGTRQMLAVDVVCLTKQDAENHREIVNRTMRAKEWFAARDRDNQGLTIDAKRIYALRGGGPSAYDTHAGAALLSGRESARKCIPVEIRHPQPFSSEARIVIYGRFHRGQEVAPTEPLLIKPPLWKKEIVVKVGRTSLREVAAR